MIKEIGKTTCNELKCTLCPFFRENLLHQCMNIRIDETLESGLKKNKKMLKEKEYESIKLIMKRKVKLTEMDKRRYRV